MAWVFAANLSALADHDMVGVVCGNTPIALYRLDDGVFATSDRCPHQGAVLSKGCVVQSYVECPAHFALFDIRTGAADGGMTAKGLKTYPTKLEGDAVYVDLDS